MVADVAEFMAGKRVSVRMVRSRRKSLDGGMISRFSHFGA